MKKAIRAKLRLAQNRWETRHIMTGANTGTAPPLAILPALCLAGAATGGRKSPRATGAATLPMVPDFEVRDYNALAMPAGQRYQGRHPLTGPQGYLPELQGADPGNGRSSPRLG